MDAGRRNRRHLLVVNYHFPPMPSVGGNRWASMAPHLRELGWDVTVLATAAYGSLPPEQERLVVRVPDLAERESLRRLLRRPPLDSAAAGSATGPLHKPAPSLLTRVLVPDAYAVSWVPAAARVARRLIRSGDVDCLVTSSPFESIHLAGLACRSRVAWVADLRDPWGSESMRPPFPTPPQRWLDRLAERRCLRTADAVVAAHRATVRDLAARLGVTATHVPNAWDPQLASGIVAPPALAEPRLGAVRLVHTGRFLSEPGRDPRAFVDAVRAVLERDPTVAERLEILVAGGTDVREHDTWKPLRVAGVLTELGSLPREQALGLQRAADVLLLFTGPRAAALPYKLVEYLAAGRPVLAMAEGSEAGEVVAATGSGAVVPIDDREAIARALETALRGELPYSPRLDEIERYCFPRVAEELAAVAAEAIEQRWRS